MRIAMALAVMMAATGAQADKRAVLPVDEVHVAMDELDAAWNAGDEPTVTKLLDPGFFGAGPYAGESWRDVEKSHLPLERSLAHGGGGSWKRTGITARADASGEVVWFVADYEFAPAPTRAEAKPAPRAAHMVGTWVKRGGAWKLAMLAQSFTPPAPPRPITRPTPGPLPPRKTATE